MSTYLQVIAGALIAVILCLSLSRQSKDISLLLGIAVCCMVMIAAIAYLKPVLDFVEKLQAIGNLDGDVLKILLRSVGIGLLAELSALICTDSGNSALAKTIHILACGVILWLSLPLMTALIDLIQKILGEI